MSSEWIEPIAGFELSQEESIVTKEYQAEKLATQGLDASIFGDHVDPSFYIGIGIRVGIASGISAEGNVNMLSRIVQHRPVVLGEALLSKGRIVSVEDVPRGRRISTDVWFEGSDGERAISVPRVSLKPDPSKAGSRGAGERPADVVEDVGMLTIVSEHRLTPEGTKGYSSEGNAIHYEMDAANLAGFRAPVIGGGQGVHFLMAAIWGHGLEKVGLDIYFRRPIFWDDTIAVGVSHDTGAVASLREGKVLTEMKVNNRMKLATRRL
jgi:hypothetical protein